MINFVTKKYISHFFIFIILFLLFGISIEPSKTKAQEEIFNCKKTASLVARNSFGEYIPNTSFAIYRQVDDVDGNPKPDKKVASGKTSAVTGRGTVSFYDKDWDSFVIEMWTEDKGRFWFYDDLVLSCDSSIEEKEEVTEFLSGFKVVLRNTEDLLLKNQTFSLFTQRYDADYEPIKEKQDLVKTANTSSEGEVVVYVPSAARSISGEGRSYYVLETTGPDGGVYTIYDLYISDGDTNDFEYVLSDMRLNLKNASNVSFPANTKVEIFIQDTSDDEQYILGDHIKDVYTDDNGIATLAYPEGVYVARIKGADEKYQYFWDLEIEDEERLVYDLSTQDSWSPGAGACEAETNLTIITKTLDGDFIPGLNYEFYEQVNDVNGIPSVGAKILSGKIDNYGKSVKVFNPDSLKKYALKIYDKNSTVGDFWFYDGWQFSCGQNKEIIEYIPKLSFVLRDGANNLKKNQKFSLYTQKYDVDGNPIKEKQDLVAAELTTSEEGVASLYVAPDHPFNKSKRGTYVLVSTGENKTIFEEYYVYVKPEEDNPVEYVFSDMILSAKNAAGQFLEGYEVSLYEQIKDLNNNYALGAKLFTTKTDGNGQARIEYPFGRYAISIKDSLGRSNEFYNINIKNRQRTTVSITSNLTRVYIYDAAGQLKGKSATIDVYDLKEAENKLFYKDKKVKSLTVGDGGYVEVMLKPGGYLFVENEKKVEYGKSVYAQNDKFQTLKIYVDPVSKIISGQGYALEKPAKQKALSQKLAGYILLQVEAHGEAWYVNPTDEKRYYMKNGATAYEMMRRFGLGISNNDLKKIPIGLDDRFEDFDYDADMLPDKMEEALGTDMYTADSDNDGFDDGIEVKNGFNPLGEGKIEFNSDLAEKLKGKIVLQVESKGEAWYINPKDGRRYYMKDGDSAYEIMRFLSLGITNINLDEIEPGSISIN